MADLSSIDDKTHYEIDFAENTLDESKSLSATVEALTQEVHELRRRLQVAQDVESHYNAEVENLHQNEARLKESFETCMQQLKDEHNVAVQEWAHKVESLEQDLEELRETNAQVLSQLEEHEKSSKECADVSDLLAALRAELQEVLSARDDDQQACQQHQELNHILMKEKLELNNQIEFMKEQLETVQARYEIANNNLTEQAESCDELRAALQVAQSELACLKAVPLAEKSRGNSLFAEVEDNRKVVEKRLLSYKQKYAHMEREYSAKCAEITKLRQENVRLLRKWEEEDKERDDREVWLVDNYEIRIKELEKTVESLKQEEKPVFINGDSNILSYASDITETSRKEIDKLREEMEWRSAERLNEAKALYSVRRDRQSLRSQLMSAQAEISLLQDRLKQANIADDLPFPRPIFKCKCQTEESEKGVKQNEVSAEVTSSSCVVKLNQRGMIGCYPVMIHPSLQAKSNGFNSLNEKPAGESNRPSDEALAHVAEQSPASRAVNTSATTFTVSNTPNLASELKEHCSLNSPIVSEHENVSAVITDRQFCDKPLNNSTDRANVSSEVENGELLASEETNEPPVASVSKSSTEPLDHPSSLWKESSSEIVQPRRNVPLRVLRAKMAEKNLPLSLNVPQPLSNASVISSGKVCGVFSENMSGLSPLTEVASLQTPVSETEEEQLSTLGLIHDQYVSKHSSFTKSLSSTSVADMQTGSFEAAVQNAEMPSTVPVEKDLSSTSGPIFSQNDQEISDVQVTDTRAVEVTESVGSRAGPTKSILSNTVSRTGLISWNHSKSRNVRFEDESESKPDILSELDKVSSKEKVHSASPKRIPKPKAVQRTYPVWNIKS